MRAIWKFPLIVRDEQWINMPRGARPLSVQVQNGTPCLWAMVDCDAQPEPHRFRLYGTGHPVDEPAQHFVGTFQMYDGSLVFHLFAGGPV